MPSPTKTQITAACLRCLVLELELSECRTDAQRKCVRESLTAALDYLGSLTSDPADALTHARVRFARMLEAA